MVGLALVGAAALALYYLYLQSGENFIRNKLEPLREGHRRPDLDALYEQINLTNISPQVFTKILCQPAAAEDTDSMVSTATTSTVISPGKRGSFCKADFTLAINLMITIQQ